VTRAERPDSARLVAVMTTESSARLATVVATRQIMVSL
jgi:hypothetical protein